jgi:hypothetical protein
MMRQATDIGLAVLKASSAQGLLKSSKGNKAPAAAAVAAEVEAVTHQTLTMRNDNHSVHRRPARSQRNMGIRCRRGGRRDAAMKCASSGSSIRLSRVGEGIWEGGRNLGGRETKQTKGSVVPQRPVCCQLRTYQFSKLVLNGHSPRSSEGTD